MSSPVSSIRNLGSAFEQACSRTGITSAEALRVLGAASAYATLLKSGTKKHFNCYYVLVMGLQGRPWNDCKYPKKTPRLRFDALQTTKYDKGHASLDAALDKIGVKRPSV